MASAAELDSNQTPKTCQNATATRMASPQILGNQSLQRWHYTQVGCSKFGLCQGCSLDLEEEEINDIACLAHPRAHRELPRLTTTPKAGTVHVWNAQVTVSTLALICALNTSSFCVLRWAPPVDRYAVPSCVVLGLAEWGRCWFATNLSATTRRRRDFSVLVEVCVSVVCH